MFSSSVLIFAYSFITFITFALLPCPLHGLRNSVLVTTSTSGGNAMMQVVETLRYKPEGHGFDTRWYHWNFSLT
jgi:hypothetical protein